MLHNPWLAMKLVRWKQEAFWREAEMSQLAALQRASQSPQPKNVRPMREAVMPTISEPRYIPKLVALELCAEVCAENLSQSYTVAALRCRLCHRLAAGNPEKLWMARKLGYRGCPQINARYAARLAAR